MQTKTLKSYCEDGKRLQLIQKRNEQMHCSTYVITLNRKILARSVNLEYICKKFQAEIYNLNMQTTNQIIRPLWN